MLSNVLTLSVPTSTSVALRNLNHYIDPRFIFLTKKKTFILRYQHAYAPTETNGPDQKLYSASFGRGKLLTQTKLGTERVN